MLLRDTNFADSRYSCPISYIRFKKKRLKLKDVNQADNLCLSENTIEIFLNIHSKKSHRKFLFLIFTFSKISFHYNMLCFTKACATEGFMPGSDRFWGLSVWLLGCES
jgi:hypothetical protein